MKNTSIAFCLILLVALVLGCDNTNQGASVQNKKVAQNDVSNQGKSADSDVRPVNTPEIPKISAEDQKKSFIKAGWKESVDEFENEVTLIRNTGMSIGCGTGNVYSAAGMVSETAQGIGSLNLVLMLYGHDDLVSPNFLKWRTDSGTKSIELECQRELDSSWNETCIGASLSISEMKSLSITDFIRIYGTSANIDLEASDESCSKFFEGITTLAKEYYAAYTGS